jgi:hypothetical protein
MTDAELTELVEKIVAAAHENLPKLKIAVPDMVRLLSDDEWEKLKDDEARRRVRKWQGRDKPGGAFWKECTARQERVRVGGNKSAECRFPVLRLREAVRRRNSGMGTAPGGALSL